eukprot:gene7656-10419_t
MRGLSDTFSKARAQRQDAIAKSKSYEEEQTKKNNDPNVVQKITNVSTPNSSSKKKKPSPLKKRDSQSADQSDSIIKSGLALPIFTKLIFVSLDGSKTEKELNDRIDHYEDLQREIARLQPNKKTLYVIQDESGAKILAEGYVTHNVVRVKETSIRIPKIETKYLPCVGTRWEHDKYYNSLFPANAAQNNIIHKNNESIIINELQPTLNITSELVNSMDELEQKEIIEQI